MCGSIRTYAFKQSYLEHNSSTWIVYQTMVCCAEDGYLVSEYYLLGFINGSQNVRAFTI